MIIDNDFDKLIEVFPHYLKNSLKHHPFKSELVEVILDLGRRPEGRFFFGTELLAEKTISWADLDKTIKSLGEFSKDNRAGIEQSLHRISCIRNREGKIIGITCRIGRCLVGSIHIIRDLLETNQSLLILGKPGTGKTTLIREISRVLSDEGQKRVIVIDTSNEIAGESNIPHKGIGRARRMQVSPFKDQHSVMIEAVENHMPEVIVVDEIGSELETFAARSIAERGVQLIGTAHGQSLANLLKNPILADLLGGIQSVTLSDEEAKRRRTQKTILERKAFPAFQMAIELTTPGSWTIHQEVIDSVDSLLRGEEPRTQLRSLQENGVLKIEAKNFIVPLPFRKEEELEIKQNSRKPSAKKKLGEKIREEESIEWILSQEEESFLDKNKKESFITNTSNQATFQGPNGEIFKKEEKIVIINNLSLSYPKISQACESLGMKACFTKFVEKADLVLRFKPLSKDYKKLRKITEKRNIPLCCLKNDSLSNIVKQLKVLIKKELI